MHGTQLLPEQLTPEQIKLLAEAAELRPAIEAREKFYGFRRYMRPDMKWNWWVQVVCLELQQFYVDLMAGKRPKMALMAPPQHGKAQLKVVPVLATTGWTTHGQLKVGDRIFHPGGATTRVVALSEDVEIDYAVELSTGETVYCHGLHEWTVNDKRARRRGDHWKTLETQELMREGCLVGGERGKRGSRYRWALPKVEPLQGVPQQLPVAPYALGVWLGNGTWDQPVITQAIGDEAPIAEMQRLGYGVSTDQKHPTIDIRQFNFANYAGRRSLREELRSLGWSMPSNPKPGTQREPKRIPERYLIAPLLDRLELLAGLIDTDGYVYHKNGRVVFVTTDEQLKNGFCQLLATFGWHGAVDLTPPHKSSFGIEGVKDCYYIGFSPTLPIPCKLKRKQLQRVFDKPKPIVIRSITKSEKSYGTGRCITVDAPDGLYLVGHTLQPTHNSWAAQDFMAWVAGKNPDLKIIFSSYSEDLGTTSNANLQRLMKSEKYQRVFPETRIDVHGWACNQSLIEFVDRRGSFRNTTVDGPINGMELHLGVIDDPHKGRAEAMSKAVREKTWSWFVDDFGARFAANSGMLILMCLTGDTQVTMADGSWKPLQTLEVGDEVKAWTPDGLVNRHVTAVVPQGEDDVLELRTEGSLVRGNARHPFLVWREDETTEWVRLGDLQRGDLIVQSAHFDAGNNRDFTVDEAWALGFMFGDGWVTKNNKLTKGYNKQGLTGKTYETASWVTCVASKEPNYPERTKRAIEILQRKFGCTFKQTRFGYWRCEKAELGRWLYAYGLQAGAKNKRVPHVLYQQISYLRKAFLDGFAAADGSLEERGEYSVQAINLSNRLLVDDLRHLARSLGHRVRNVSEQRRKLDYALPPNSLVAQEWFSANFGYHWKTVTSQPLRLARVKSIKPCGRAEVFDISVAGEANFLADGLVAHNTRWHVDDLLGRYLEKFPETRIVRFPAIAEENEYCNPTEPDTPTRRRGQALFPAVKPLRFLLERKKLMTELSWESEYQQNPIVLGGGLFPIDKLQTLNMFDRNEVRQTVRYWDKAGTEGGEGAYTAGVLMHAMKNKTYVVGHVVRGRWGALEREEQIKAWAKIDRDNWGWGYEIYVEQEPGSGGKESAEATIRNLPGYRVFCDRVTGKKEIRAEPFAAQVQGGNVRLLAGPWQGDFLAELEAFPNGKYKDQVDACSGAFAKLTGDGYYNIDSLAS